ncbi:suppressor of hpr1 [Coemansia interrupta]|uniref:Mediator of RNA polymerase II transcription subunit 31 n=1 Tax=Coemansia interrupta TaxID=1126814 RepID=A0A9W8HMC2_9FUNG|nr:suppressor of hpr1 [Coemansia interrupta]
MSENAVSNAGADTTDDMHTSFMKERFEVELEFVQCLANPWYINFIAQQGYFEKPEFLNFLKYLQYWKKPEYSRFIVYPHALAFLDLLQHKEFRDGMKTVDEATRVHGLQYHHWRWPNYQNGSETLPADSPAAANFSTSTSGA